MPRKTPTRKTAAPPKIPKKDTRPLYLQRAAPPAPLAGDPFSRRRKRRTSAEAAAIAKFDQPLEPAELRFIREYVLTLDADAAAKLAGLPARRILPLLKDPRARTEIQKHLRPVFEKRGVTREAVLERLGDVALSDPRKFFDAETGKLLNPSKLDERTAVALGGIKISQSKTHFAVTGNGESVRIDEQTIEVKRLDPTPALTVLAKHFGLIGDGGERRSADDGRPSGGLPPINPETLAAMDDRQLAAIDAALSALAPIEAEVVPVSKTAETRTSDLTESGSGAG